MRIWDQLVRNSPDKAHFFPIRRQLRWGERSPFRVLFTKDLKGVGKSADKESVSTLAHTMMTAARSTDSGLGKPGRTRPLPLRGGPRSRPCRLFCLGECGT